MRPGLLGLAAVVLTGCTTLEAPAFADGTPVFQPDRFFSGTTRSTGVLEDRSGRPTRRLHVEGAGESLPDGDLTLTQRITFDDDPATVRRWTIHRVDAHRYEATLTDAAGPVAGEAFGNLFHLRYAMQTPRLGHMEQWLYLQPDGRTVLNEATITILGVVVARLSERITHLD